MHKYQPQIVEKKWAEKWSEVDLYAPRLNEDKKYYVLAEFAYPSGDLHIGHIFTWTGADVFARFKRMQGNNVFFPNGFDAFGLPAENAAIKRGVHPQDWTYANIESMKRQYSKMGGSFSFENEVITCDPSYYKWNQWLFVKMFERGLAYRGSALSNWCNSCQTVLANEGVDNGNCWRCGNPVVQKQIAQWFWRITDYADRLVWPDNRAKDSKGEGSRVKGEEKSDEWKNNSHPELVSGSDIVNSKIATSSTTPHNDENSGSRNEFGPSALRPLRLEELTNKNNELNWPKSVMEGQNNWIGRSEGMEIEFIVKPLDSAQGEREVGPPAGGGKWEVGNRDLSSRVSNERSHAANSEISLRQLTDRNDKNSGSRNEFGMTSSNDQKRVNETSGSITVYTVYPETVFGVTYLVVAPEYPGIEELANEEQKKAVNDYIKTAQSKTEEERKIGEKDKTGVFTGSFVVNPVNGREVPIWVADYVLGNYGTGAVMGVPGSDHRDFEFAKKYDLPILQVIASKDDFSKSFLMGADKIEDKELTDLGIKITEKADGGSRKLEIPNNKLSDYEKLVANKMEPGFWNEYVGEKTVFTFKHKDGTIERLELNPETEERIDKLAAEFNGQNWTNLRSVWAWLADNDFYTDLVVLEEGILVNSEQFDGLTTPLPAREKIKDYLEKKGWGKRKKQYHLRDWSVSRQRYWGTPVPIINCDKCGAVAVPEADLPVLLPYEVDFTPKGKPPLATDEKWLHVECSKCGGKATREAETMDTFIDSSWYFFRYLDPKNEKEIFDTEVAKKWMPVDIYFGGAEHTLGHTLYARFVSRVIQDLKGLEFEEFATKRVNHGIILGPDGAKMSKSKGNVVNPDKEIDEYGADTIRTFLCFLMPYDGVGAWIPERINGVYRFLQRIWGLHDKVSESVKMSKEDRFTMNKVIKDVTAELEETKFNTSVAKLMEWLNYLSAKEAVAMDEYQTMLKLLAPFAPFMTEELWQTSKQLTANGRTDTTVSSRTPIESGREISGLDSLGSLGGTRDDKQGGESNEGANGLRLTANGEQPEFKSIHLSPWPSIDEAALVQDLVKVPVQINGKLRANIEISPSASEDEVKEAVKGTESLKKYLEGNEIKKMVYIPGKIVSLVV